MKIFYYTFGCKVNQYETENVRELFEMKGHETVSNPKEADVCVINSCTVTAQADSKCFQMLRRLRKQLPEGIIVLAGCLPQTLDPDTDDLALCDIIVGTNEKRIIPELVERFIVEGERIVRIKEHSRGEAFEVMTNYGDKRKTRAYIKIQEGCNKFCSYCLIPYARGQIRSRSVDAIVEEASQLISRGYRELILTGINTALYGMEDDFEFEARDDEAGLRGIEVAIKRVNELPGDFRIRLSSLEPNVVDVEHVERLLKYNKLCHHLHLALQSGSDHVLDLMHRDYTREEFLDIVRALRAKDPLFGITTDIIAGFPGETEEDFEDTLDMVRRAEFGKVHPFRYSPRKGTKAFSMGDTITGEVKNRRARELGKAGEEAARRFHEKNLGTVARVLVESIEDGIAQGYSANYIKVRFKADEQTKQGEFRSVRLVEIYNEGCLGEATEEGR